MSLHDIPHLDRIAKANAEEVAKLHVWSAMTKAFEDGTKSLIVTVATGDAKPFEPKPGVK